MVNCVKLELNNKMALSDSMFLFEIALEELRSYGNNKRFVVRSQFADIFSLVLNDPTEAETLASKRRKASKSKIKVKYAKDSISRFQGKPKAQTGQSILFASNIDLLMSYMLRYPMEVSLWSKQNPEERIGSSLIPWNPAFVEFLARLYKSEEPPPVVVNDLHNVFNESTSKRMASIKLNIKLSYIKDRISRQFRALSEERSNTIIYKSFVDPKPVKVSTTLKKPSAPVLEGGTGVIKTIFSGKRKKKITKKSSVKKNKNITDIGEDAEQTDTVHKDTEIKYTEDETSFDHVELNQVNMKSRIDKSILSFIKSETDIDKSIQKTLSATKSCSSIKQLNTLNYVFGDRRGPFGSRIYTVGYFTVEKPSGNKSSNSTIQGSGSVPQPSVGQASEPSIESKIKYKFKLCTNDCPSKSDRHSLSECSLDLPEKASHLITVTKCKNERCDYKKDRDYLDPGDERILLDINSIKRPCCAKEAAETIKTTIEEQMVGSMKATLKLGDDPCYCACECVFGIGKKTTYCKVCGGYEVAGEDTANRPQYMMPVPCPIYHKLGEKNKAKTGSTSGSESKKKRKSELLLDQKKGKKKRRDDRFKFNYGYKGIPPQIGHSQCAMPCTGSLNNVPKTMGWLWTADNVPGLKFRPLWKPGAVNKFVLRLLKIARNPGEVSKKRRKDTGKAKRPLKRPLLVVHKKDGEYSVTMETMKAYSKPRALNQHPYEDKPVITYTIGRTEEENRERRKKKERAQRRLEREQREFIQSAFRDMCQEICMKTYQQALGILPDTEDPECTCYPALPGPDRTDLNHSCSCSEDSASLASDTDSDEWIVEFTPPNAHFDPTYKGKKIWKSENATQYSYLDYKVKLLDRFGNPVPRFFKGLDGQQICSDLGGFWSADHQWQEINVDGFVGPDGRWIPMTFIGPSGEQVDVDNTGKFQTTNMNWLVAGVDGFIDSQGKWKAYPKPKTVPDKKRRTFGLKKGAGDRNAKTPQTPEKSEPTWSCFGDASPTQLSKMGVVGHGPDRRLLHETLNDLVARGEKDIKLPQVSRVPRSASRRGRRPPPPGIYDSRTYFSERTRCKHPVPSDKGIVVDTRGHKTYFKSKDWKNRRPKDRLVHLEDQGISLSTFHEPCFHSFIDNETMKQQLRERLMNMAAGHQSSKRVSQVANNASRLAKTVSTQAAC